VHRIGVLVAAILLGAVAGLGAGALLWSRDEGPEPSVRGSGELASLPSGRVLVRAETVRLPAGFESRHRHGGPTFNLVRAGLVVIADPRGLRRYGAGELFFEPGGVVHTIRVVDDARIDVIRVLPPGAPATTELR
jgi:hypothetical protein